MTSSSTPSFASLALSKKVVKPALKIALIVGSILAAINHGHAIINADFSIERVVQMALTYLVPYCVSTYSAVKAIQQH